MKPVTVNRRSLLKSTAGAGLTAGLGLKPFVSNAHELILNTIPGTTEPMPAIGLGTSAFFNGTPEENAQFISTLDAFAALGGIAIDTAPVYRTSESLLGNWMSQRENRDKLFVATKVEKKVYGDAIKRMGQSVEKLQTPIIDLIQSHQMNGAENSLPAMREWQEEGRVRYVGITTSDTETFPRMLELMKTQALDFIQVNYSLSNREAADEILPLAQDKGIAVLINIPFARGKLFQAVEGKTLPNWATEFDCHSWAQFFLKYVISHPAVTAAIPGATKTRHVIDNFAAAFGALPDAKLRLKQAALLDEL